MFMSYQSLLDKIEDSTHANLQVRREKVLVAATPFSLCPRELLQKMILIEGILLIGQTLHGIVPFRTPGLASQAFPSLFSGSHLSMTLTEGAYLFCTVILA